MQDQAWFNLVGGVAVALVLVVGLSAIVFSPQAATPSPSVGGSHPSASVSRDLSIAYDSAAGDFVYSTSQLTVPQGVPVIFTITNFDPSPAQLPSPSYAHVNGTLDGEMSVSTPGGTVSTTWLAPNDVGHTFTVWNGYQHLNVPIPPASSRGTSIVITFMAVFSTRGTFTFGCVALCGDSNMAVPSPMFGTLTVS